MGVDETNSGRGRSLALFSLFAIAPAVLAVTQLGRLHPDEVYQMLEPAFHRVFGYGVVAWEWQPNQGLRNWGFPLIYAGLLKLCVLVGIEHPRVYRAVLALPQVVLHAGLLHATYAYCERRVGAQRARWAVVLMGLWGIALIFAGRTLGESISAPLLAMGLERLDRNDSKQGFLGGLLLGLAVIARYGSGVVVVVALLYLLVARRFRVLLPLLAGGLIALLGLAALDWATWGKPLHSLLAYLDINVLSKKGAAQFGQSPVTLYALPLLLATPLWAWLGIFRTRPGLPLVAALGYFAAIAFTPHKEARFLYPGLVLLALAGLPGVLTWSKAWALSLLSLGSLFIRGELEVQRADQFRNEVRATRPPATGLLIVGDGLWGVGGYFYMGQNIPFRTCDFAADLAFRMSVGDPRFNRAITYDHHALPELQAAGFKVVREDDRSTLLER